MAHAADLRWVAAVVVALGDAVAEARVIFGMHLFVPASSVLMTTVAMFSELLARSSIVDHV
jgi:hypothetical protein